MLSPCGLLDPDANVIGGQKVLAQLLNSELSKLRTIHPKAVRQSCAANLLERWSAISCVDLFLLVFERFSNRIFDAHRSNRKDISRRVILNHSWID